MMGYLVERLQLSCYSGGIYARSCVGRGLKTAEIRVQFWDRSNISEVHVDRSGSVTVRQAPPEPAFAA